MLKRDEILKKFKSVNEQIEELQNSKTLPYVTTSKYIPTVGYVHELDTIEQLIRAQKIVNEQKNGVEQAAKSLGLDVKDITEEDFKFFGFSIETWESDIKNRLSEIRKNSKLEKLNSVKKVLKKNLSEDDKFELEMSGIEQLLDDLSL
jgi:hypothetical protein